jgi:hypothetical protein
MTEVERLLRGALVPIDPPGALGDRLERRLTELTDAAVGEWADFDPSALRSPRRWARLVVAGLVGAGAGGALILVRARQNQKKRDGNVLQSLQKGMRDVASDARRRVDR